MSKPTLSFQHDALLGAYERQMLERIDSETEALADGRAADFADYKARCSSLRAMRRALEDLRVTVRTYLEEDDDND